MKRGALLAEFLGTAMLLSVVVGSGIMGHALYGAQDGPVLLVNALATAGGLYVLIHLWGPVSGAHFNPVVSFALAATGALALRVAFAYAAAQAAGAIAGTLLAHAMFGLAMFEVSARVREGPALAFSEFLATAGLVLIVLRVPAARAGAVVAAYIGTAYWFTASTSFANPAAVLGRMFTGTFAGIAPVSAAAFVAAQMAGGWAGWRVNRSLPVPD